MGGVFRSEGGHSPAPTLRLPMSEDPRPPRRSESLPPIVWALAGVLVVALFVLAIALLNPPS